MPAAISPVRSYRAREKKSLDWLADQIARRTGERPSKAKLSRIENGLQLMPLDLIPHVSAITGLPPKVLRPDVAALFTGKGGR